MLICPIAGVPAKIEEIEPDLLWVVSPRAGGQYVIRGTTVREELLDQKVISEIGKKLDWDERCRLASLIYELQAGLHPLEPGRRKPVISPEDIDRCRTFPKSGQRGRHNLPILERKVRMLKAFRTLRPKIGQPGPANDPFLLAASESTIWDELRGFWTHASEQGFVEFESPLPPAGAGQSAKGVDVWLTFEGHAWLETLEKTNVDSDQGFVAMWFDDSLDEIYRAGFAPAIEAAGYRPLRVDYAEFAGKIDDEVIAQIRRSRFAVADLTSGAHSGEVIPRGSVYYEAGFAEGLGIPVLYTRREGMEEAVHFDLRQHNFIVWKDVDDLRKRLARRISAVLGDGPHRQQQP